MSDLHRAVQAELEAHLPERTPPFAELKSRKRRRDQRRTVGAVVLSAAAVVGVAVIPGALGLRDGQAQQAAGAGPALPFSVNWAERRDYNDDVDAALNRECFALPGVRGVGAATSLPPSYSGQVSGEDNAEALRVCVARTAPGAALRIDGAPAGGPREFSYSLRWTDQPTSYYEQVLQDLEDECLDGEAFTDGMVAQSLPPVVSGRVAGRDNADRLEACVRRYAPGSTLLLIGPALVQTVTGPVSYGLSYNDDGRYAPADDDFLRRCLDLPGVSDVQAERSRPPRYGVTVTGAEENGKFRACVGGSVPNVVLREWGPADVPTPQEEPGALRLPTNPLGATICLGEHEDGRCRLVDEAAARSLVQVLNTSRPATAADSLCRSLAEAFMVTFEHISAFPSTIEVSRGCGPLVVLGKHYNHGPEVKAAVARAYEAGSPIDTDGATGPVLRNLRADCGDAGQIVVMGVVQSSSEAFEDGLKVELRADGAKLGDAALTAPGFTIRNANPSGLPDTGQLVLLARDGATLAVENVSLRPPPGLLCR